jgi:hypothetical protein
MKTPPVTDMTGHCCCDKPLERHEFTGSGFECSVCRRPRAMHSNDGFHPFNLPSRMPQDPACRFRGPHPRFSKPGAFNPEAIPEVTQATKKRVAAIRLAEKRALERAIKP